MTDKIATRKLGFVFDGTIYLSDSFTLLRNKVLELGAHRVDGEKGTDIRNIVRPLPQTTLEALVDAFDTRVVYVDEDGEYTTTAALQKEDPREANPLAEVLEEIHVLTCRLSLDYPCTGEDAGEYGQELFDAGDEAGLDELLRVLHLEDEDATANGPLLDALIYPGSNERAVFPPVVDEELDDEELIGAGEDLLVYAPEDEAAEIAALFGAKLVEDESLAPGELELDLSDEAGSFSEFKARENIAQGWKIGDPVRVTRGPFKGRIGRVEGIARGIEVRVENSFLCVVSAGELETQPGDVTTPLATDRIIKGDELTEEVELWIGGKVSALIGAKNTFKVGDRVDTPQFPTWNGSKVTAVDIPGQFPIRLENPDAGPGIFRLEEVRLAPETVEYEIGSSHFYHSETPDEWPEVARRIRETLKAGRRVILEPCFIDRPNGYYVHVTADPEDVS